MAQLVLSNELEEGGLRLAAVRLPPAPPAPPPPPAVPGLVRGPALLCALRGAEHFASVARQLPDVPGALRIASYTGKIGYRRNTGQRGGGGDLATSTAVPTLEAFVTMVTQAWRGLHELGDNGGHVHALLDAGGAPPPPGRAGALLPPYTARQQFEQQLAALDQAREGTAVPLAAWVQDGALGSDALATVESLQLKSEITDMYGWAPGAAVKKAKTYAGVLAAAGRRAADAAAVAELHYESEILRDRCLAPAAPFALLLLARHLPARGIRLRFARGAADLAHQLLGLPPAPAAAPPRVVEMWLADAATGRRLASHLLPYPMTWGHAGVQVTTCSSGDSRMRLSLIHI